MSPQDYYTPLKQTFEQVANPTNALPMKKYMKNHFEFLGIKTPERKMIYRDFFSQYGLPPKENFHEIILALWQEPEREYQYFAMELLDKCKKYFDESTINLLEKLITQKSWWDTVDLLASHSVGHYFKKYPQNITDVTIKFMESNNIWLQRTCILFQLGYKKSTNETLLYEYICMCADSKEFFLQKAIGWALRQYARTNARSVLQFVEATPLKPLSKREALKHF